MNIVIVNHRNHMKFVPVKTNLISSKMKTLKFKTNINCSGCVAKVTKTLNQTAGEDNWAVDTNVPEKTLTVKTDDLSAEEVEEAVRSVGFKIEEE
jgi:copper chaperone